jgi:hypothetical protein
MRVEADAIVDTYIDILDENDKKGKRSDTVISWTLTALSKLAVKLPQVKEKINELVDGYTDHGNVEIQQRAFEYRQLFEPVWEEERNGLFEAMPFKGDEGMTVS